MHAKKATGPGLAFLVFFPREHPWARSDQDEVRRHGSVHSDANLGSSCGHVVGQACLERESAILGNRDPTKDDQGHSPKEGDPAIKGVRPLEA